MRITRIVGPLVLVGLTGCAEMATKEAVQKAHDHCASEGKQFIEKSVTKDQGLVLSSATVTGQCVGPGDAGYVPPAKISP